MIDLEHLCGIMGQSLGQEKAHEVLSRAAAQVGVSNLMSREDALNVLESVALNEDGLISIAARFAKSRIHLIMTS